MKLPQLFGSRFWIFLLAVLALEVTLEFSEAQGPGHLSSSRGKRWFTKQEEPRTEGLLSRRIETRKARIKAQRDQAIAAATQESSTDEAEAEEAHPASPSEERSPSHRRAKPAASSSSDTAEKMDTSRKKSVKVMKRSVGQRGSGSMPIKRRRTLLRPLFGD